MNDRSTHEYSPHAWGWTGPRDAHPRPGGVFPTRVGMDREISYRIHRANSIPHTRGDGPILNAENMDVKQYSPHAWGWTVAALVGFAAFVVFPTRVGMDRQ